MTSLTPGQLLKDKTLALSGPTLDIDSDIPLDKKTVSYILRAFREDNTLVGLTVVASDDQPVGALSIAMVKEYIARSATVGRKRDGLATGPSVMMPLFYRCDAHQPLLPLPYQRISWTQPKCRVCGKPMKLVEG